MNRTDRLYALVEELRAMAPRPRTARQLAARYEVSTRTIERDILALQESGVPVYAETGRHGGYVVDKRLTLPPVNFTAAEMVAIAVSLAWAEGTPFAFAARSALRKVLAVAPAGQTAEAAELVDRIRLIKAGPSVKNGPRPARAQAHPMVPLSVQEAITARHVLLLDYRDGRDAVTVREVEPVAFAGTRDHWYLLAWCRLRDGARAFRVDRACPSSTAITGTSPAAAGPKWPGSRRATRCPIGPAAVQGSARMSWVPSQSPTRKGNRHDRRHQPRASDRAGLPPSLDQSRP